MATYVDFSSDEEQLMALVSLLDKTKGEDTSSLMQHCSSLLEANKMSQIIEKLLQESVVLFKSGGHTEKGITLAQVFFFGAHCTRY